MSTKLKVTAHGSRGCDFIHPPLLLLPLQLPAPAISEWLQQSNSDKVLEGARSCGTTSSWGQTTRGEPFGLGGDRWKGDMRQQQRRGGGEGGHCSSWLGSQKAHSSGLQQIERWDPLTKMGSFDQHVVQLWSPLLLANAEGRRKCVQKEVK